MLLNRDVAAVIASFCGDHTRRAFALVSKDWRTWFSDDDAVWEQCLFADFDVAASSVNRLLAPAVDHAARGEEAGRGYFRLLPHSSCKLAWLAWRAFELQMHPLRISQGKVWSRALTALATIRDELASLGCLARLNLNAGSFAVPQKLLKQFANQPVTLETIRAIWGTHNGQQPGQRSGGLFGLTQYYNHDRALRMLTLQEMSHDGHGDEFTLVIAKGNPSGGGGEGGGGEERLCFDPRELQVGNSYYYHSASQQEQPHHGRAFNSLVFPIQGDVLLGLFEDYAEDLRRNKRTVLQLHGLPHASAFSARHTISQATTRGITVRASFKYLPAPAVGRQQQQQQQHKDLFVYQIRISGSSEVPVMLVTRHWTFVDGQQVEHVEGEGVVGHYPVLGGGGEDGRIGEMVASPNGMRIRWRDDDDREDFAYQSCTYAHPNAYMEGYFTFAPLILREEGATPPRLDMANSFQVRVARLTFTLPTFAY